MNTRTKRRWGCWWLLVGTCLAALPLPAQVLLDWVAPAPLARPYRLGTGPYAARQHRARLPDATRLTRHVHTYGSVAWAHRPRPHFQWHVGHAYTQFAQHEVAGGVVDFHRHRAVRGLPAGTRLDVLSDAFDYHDLRLGASVRSENGLWLGATLHHYRGGNARLDERAYARVHYPDDGPLPYLHYQRVRRSTHRAEEGSNGGWGLSLHLHYQPNERWRFRTGLQHLGAITWRRGATRHDAAGYGPYAPRLGSEAQLSDALDLLASAYPWTDRPEAFRQSVPTTLLVAGQLRLGPTGGLEASYAGTSYRRRTLATYRLGYRYAPPGGRWHIGGGGGTDQYRQLSVHLVTTLRLGALHLRGRGCYAAGGYAWQVGAYWN